MARSEFERKSRLVGIRQRRAQLRRMPEDVGDLVQRELEDLGADYHKRVRAAYIAKLRPVSGRSLDRIKIRRSRKSLTVRVGYTPGDLKGRRGRRRDKGPLREARRAYFAAYYERTGGFNASRRRRQALSLKRQRAAGIGKSLIYMEFVERGTKYLGRRPFSRALKYDALRKFHPRVSHVLERGAAIIGEKLIR